MRPIKFRGKRLDSGEWAYGSLVIREQDVHGTPGYFISAFGGEWIAVNPETVGQYTGLKDKNGKEIYESDFLELAKEWYLVEWHFNRWVLRDTHNKIHEFHKLSLDAGWYEVVGNNYENR